MFSQLFSETGEGHDTLLLQSEARRLPRGKSYSGCLSCVLSCVGLKEAKPTSAKLFSNPKWLTQLICLADVFNILNELNLFNHGGNASALDASDRIKAFRGKTEMWNMRVFNVITDMFPKVTEFPDTSNQPSW